MKSILRHSFIMLLITVALYSCKTIAPQRSPEQIAALTEIQASVNSMYDAMSVSPDRSYSTFEPNYTNIGQKVQSVVEVNKTREQASNILKQSEILQQYFEKYRSEHQQAGSITPSQIRVYRSYLQSFIKPVLVSELSLKE